MTEAFLREPPADIGRRAFAYLIDVVVAAGLALVLSGVFFGIVVLNAASSDRSTVALGVLLASGAVGLASVVWAVVYTVMQGGGGSIGQRTVGIRLVDAATEASIGFWRALLRNVVWVASTAILIGYVTVFFDGSGRRRGWHDLAARAVMVDRSGRPVASNSAVTPTPESALVTGIGRSGPAEPNPVTSAESGDIQRAAVPGPVISFVPGVTGDPIEARAAASGALSARRETAVATPPAVQTVGRVADPGTVDQTRAAPAPWVSLTWDDGSRIGVYGRTLFGRNPAGEPGVAVIALRDETLSLSKTHFEVDGDARGVWIVDRHSTNGTSVVREGRRIDLVAGDRMPIRAGDRLEFGDRSALVGGAG